MKKRTLLPVTILAMLALVACNPTQPSSSQPSSSSETSSSETSSEPTPSSSEEGINHQDPLVADVEDAFTRPYNAEFDTMVDDFSSTTINGEGTGEILNNRLRVLVDSNNGDFPSSPDASIYKVGTGTYEIHNYEGIGFKIRKVGAGKLALEDLVLGLRGDDAYKVYELSLADAVNPDGDPLEELTEEFADLVVAPGLSIDDDTTEYELADGSGLSGVKVLEKILGFHLFAKNEVSQLIEIEEVYLVQAGTKTTLDNFSRDAKNKADDTCWWRDSTGFILRDNMHLRASQNYTTGTAVAINDHTNIVLRVAGSTEGVTVNNVAWANLKDPDGNAVKNAVNGGFHSFVINLENSGIDGESFTVALGETGTDLYIDQVFYTSLQNEAAVTEYPLIDTKNAAMFDNFNRTQSGFNGNYEESIANPIVTDAGLDYALSYSHGDKVTVANGVATLDATELGEKDYINFKEGNDGIYANHKYFVLVAKFIEGATVDNFRFDLGSGVTYFNQMFSAAGLPLPALDAQDYPYETTEGFRYYIVDLEKSGMTGGAYVDLYYSGTGKVLIDAMFYTNEYSSSTYEDRVVGEGSVADLTGYVYAGGFSADGLEEVSIRFTSTAGTTLKSIRFENPNAEQKWIKDGVVIDTDGNPVDPETVVNADGVTINIDLVASGLTGGWIHMHTGGFDGSTGDIQFVATGKFEVTETVTEVLNVKVEGVDGYQYVGYAATEGAKIARVTVSSTVANTLESIRFENNSAEQKWIKDGVVIGVDGNPIDATQSVEGAGVTFDIDLEASGLVGGFHVHSGGFGSAAGDLTIVVRKVEPISSETVTDVLNKKVEGAEGYQYVGYAATEGAKIARVTVSSTVANTLESIRFENNSAEQKWIKDSLIIGVDGNPIDATQSVEGAGITFDIDLEASGLVGGFHVHSGGFGSTTGDLTIVVSTVVPNVPTYADVMASLNQ